MAQYFTDFSTNQAREDPPPPDGWTRYLESPSFVGWDVIQYNGVNCVSPQAIGPSANFNTLAWDEPGIAGTVDAVLTYTPDYDSYVINNDAPFGLMVASDIATRGYAVGFFLDGSTNSVQLTVRRFQEMLGSLGWFNVQSVPFAASAEEMFGAIYKLRVQVSGTIIKARAWKTFDPEPNTWQIDVDHSSVVPGYVGLCGSFYGSTREAHQFPKYYSVAVGTDGDPAPEGEAEGIGKGTSAVSADLAADGELLLSVEGAISSTSSIGAKGPWTLATDYSEYPLDQSPEDWTPRGVTLQTTWAVVDIYGDPVLAVSADGTASRGMSWDKAGIVDDVEVVTQVLYQGGAGPAPYGAAIRGQGASDTYVVGIWDVNSVRSLVIKDNNYTEVLASAPISLTSGYWHWLKVQAVGNVLKAKIWRRGFAEPTDWAVEVTDSRYTSGWVGIWGYQHVTTLGWSFFGVGANGAPAPMKAPTSASGTIAASSTATGDAEVVIYTGKLVAVSDLSGKASSILVAQGSIGTTSRLSGVPYTPAGGVAATFIVVDGRPYPRIPGSPGFAVIDGRPFTLVGLTSGSASGSTEIAGSISVGSSVDGRISVVGTTEIQGSFATSSSITGTAEVGGATAGYIHLNSSLGGTVEVSRFVQGSVLAASDLNGDILSLAVRASFSSASMIEASATVDLEARGTITATAGVVADSDIPGFPTASGTVLGEAVFAVQALRHSVGAGEAAATSVLDAVASTVTWAQGTVAAETVFLATPDTSGMIVGTASVQGQAVALKETAGAIEATTYTNLDGAGEVSVRGFFGDTSSVTGRAIPVHLVSGSVEISASVSGHASRAFPVSGVTGGISDGSAETAYIHWGRATSEATAEPQGIPAYVRAIEGSVTGQAGDYAGAGVLSPSEGVIAAASLMGTDLRIAQEVYGTFGSSSSAALRVHRALSAGAGASMTSEIQTYVWSVLADQGSFGDSTTLQAGAALVVSSTGNIPESLGATAQAWVEALASGDLEVAAKILLDPGSALSLLGSIPGNVVATAYAIRLKVPKASGASSTSVEAIVQRILRSSGAFDGVGGAAAYGDRDRFLRGVIPPAALFFGGTSEMLTIFGETHGISLADGEAIPGPGNRRVGSLIGRNYVAIDTAVEVAMVSFVLKQGDTSPAIEALLRYGDGSAVDLGGATVRFHLADLDGNLVVSQVADIVDPVRGRVRYPWLPEDTATAGRYLAEWEVTYPDGAIETFPNHDQVMVRIISQLG